MTKPVVSSRGPMASLAALLGRTRTGLPAVGQTPYDVVFTENKWRLLRFRANPAATTRARTPILMVPSLINRWYVLDLAPGRSFCEWLVARGHDVFIVDWGTPTAEDRFLSWDDICDRYVGRAVRKVANASPDGEAHVLGYCLGGTLTTAYAAANPAHVASLALLAAPIDFAQAGMMTTWSRADGLDLGAIVKGFGNMPWPIMQAAFHTLKPTANAAKVVALLDRAWDDEFLDGFLATERWGNDNVSFPGRCYQEYIQSLYRENRLLNDELALSGKPALLGNIDAPTLVVAFEQDHIVPPGCALALLDRIASPDRDKLMVRGGHVGAVVSKKAAAGLWRQLSEWWLARDTPEARGL